MRRAGLAAAAALLLLSVLAGVVAQRPAAAGAGPASPRGLVSSGDTGRGSVSQGKDAEHRLQIVANLRARQLDAPVVILLGGSSARESTVDDADWSAQIARLGGTRVVAYNLGCRHDTFALDKEIAGLLPPGLPALVFIGINLGRFTSPPATPTVTLPEPDIPPPVYFQHIYSVQKKVQTTATKQADVQYWMARRWPEYRARYAGNLAILEAVVQTCIDRGLYPVLLDLPRDLPVIGHAFDKPVAMYKAGCEDIAYRYDIPFLHFVAAAGLVDGDFFDIFHLVEPGRVKYQRLLSQRAAALLDRYGLDRPPVPPTPTPTPTPTLTPTPRPTPTVTPTPTASPTVTPSPTPTSWPTYTPTPEPTPWSTYTPTPASAP